MIRISFLITGVLAFFITAVSGFVLIPWLKKVKFGQTIKEIGPTWHRTKQGTPTMGGLMFYLGSFLGICAGLSLLMKELQTITGVVYTNHIISLCISMLTALGFGFIGFVDDYIKVVKKRNLGLKAAYKIFGQIFVTAAFLYGQYYIGHVSTYIQIPFVNIGFELGYFYYVVAFLGIIFMVNAVNLTDGIDGLCSSVSFVVALGFMFISAAYGYYTNAIFSIAVAGACAGFLAWNFYPAKVFMGDTGSMFLGGAVVAMAWAVNRPEILLFMGIIYTCEALSVVIQVLYFKATHGKRIFKMSPIHHHYEMSGWSEVKIVTVFSIVQLIFTVMGCIGF
ncbi:MAG: phospho-N-acetylmuramoyl-pentapeptide-transferase [Oscillospiraceae bacterium]|nr:phospho-N-acetylmuramoyl-pentapeptide-transferase [Oscillospiraceae bacterium]